MAGETILVHEPLALTFSKPDGPPPPGGSSGQSGIISSRANSLPAVMESTVAPLANRKRRRVIILPSSRYGKCASPEAASHYVMQVLFQSGDNVRISYKKAIKKRARKGAYSRREGKINPAAGIESSPSAHTAADRDAASPALLRPAPASR